MSDTNVFVTISNNKRIPFINKIGPISSPISILKTHAAQLKKMGFDVKEHATKDVTIDIAGNRVLPYVFAKLPEGEVVETAKNMPTPLVPTPTSIELPPVVEVKPETPVAEIIAAQDQAEESSESEQSEESSSDESEAGEEGEVEILSLEAYQKMSVALLRGWLHKHEAYLEADIIAEIDSAKKDRLIEIIDVCFIKAADAAE
jgi:hypothetical protein